MSEGGGDRGPLCGLRVLDFSTRLPGPLATLMLTQSGAEVIKIERPGTGDDMRQFGPQVNGASVLFEMLNRGKKSIALDLKHPGAIRRLSGLLGSCDVLVEQFRPGVMDRLGLGYDAVSAINPRVIYCSISGYPRSSPCAAEAGHDLNYLARSGALALLAGREPLPPTPDIPLADIGGGSLPAVINILLALQHRVRTGMGCHIEVPISKNVLSFLGLAIAGELASHELQVRTGVSLTGSPRYRIYPTLDGRGLAVAALEEPFWSRFCDLIALPVQLRDERVDAQATAEAVAARIASRPASEWEALFSGEDVCCSIVRTPETAFRELLGDPIEPEWLTPLDKNVRSRDSGRTAPALGSANTLLPPA